jgi:hypothetical protein
MGRISKATFQSLLSSHLRGRYYEAKAKLQHRLDMPASHGNTLNDAQRSVGGLCNQHSRSTKRNHKHCLAAEEGMNDIRGTRSTRLSTKTLDEVSKVESSC